MKNLQVCRTTRARHALQAHKCATIYSSRLRKKSKHFRVSVTCRSVRTSDLHARSRSPSVRYVQLHKFSCLTDAALRAFHCSLEQAYAAIPPSPPERASATCSKPQIPTSARTTRIAEPRRRKVNVQVVQSGAVQLTQSIWPRRYTDLDAAGVADVGPSMGILGIRPAQIGRAHV